MEAVAKKILKIELPAIPPELLETLNDEGIAALEHLSENEQTAIWEWSRAVVRAYRSILETDQRNVRDISELPFGKEHIKLAIKIALPLYISKNLQRMIRVLKNAYKELGTFQDLCALGSDEMPLKDQLNAGAPQENSISTNNNLKMDVIVTEKKALTEEINNFVADFEAAV
jgi:hypothetical protein